MTKLKSKKMTKSTLAIIIMGIAIVALLAFGGSFAYFTASTTAKTGAVTMGSIKLEMGGSFEATLTNILPGDDVITTPITVTPSVVDASTGGEYIIVKFSVTGAKAQALGLDVTLGNNFYKLTGYRTNSEAANDSIGDLYYYFTDGETHAPAAATSETELTLLSAASISTDVYAQSVDGANDETGLMGAQVTISVQSKGLQGRNVTGDVKLQLAKLFYSDAVANTAG